MKKIMLLICAMLILGSCAHMHKCACGSGKESCKHHGQASGGSDSKQDEECKDCKK